MPTLSAGQELELIVAEVELLPERCRESFQRSIEAGTHPRMALMFASNLSPTMGTTSDRQFLSSGNRQMANMGEVTREKIIGIAKRAGINTHGKIYVGGLGRHDDPRAWVSSNDDVRRVCEERGMTAVGPGINYESKDEATPAKKVKLAPDLIAEMRTRLMTSDPGLAEKCRKSKTANSELTERVVDQYGAR